MRAIIEAICAKGLPKRDIHNANRVNLLALLWASTMLLGTVIIGLDFPLRDGVFTVVLLLHITISIMMLLAFKRFITELDELEKKVQLDALAIAVGVAIIVFSSGSILANAALLPELKPWLLIIIIAVTYMVGIIKGRLAYR